MSEDKKEPWEDFIALFRTSDAVFKLDGRSLKRLLLYSKRFDLSCKGRVIENCVVSYRSMYEAIAETPEGLKIILEPGVCMRINKEEYELKIAEEKALKKEAKKLRAMLNKIEKDLEYFEKY